VTASPDLNGKKKGGRQKERKKEKKNHHHNHIRTTGFLYLYHHTHTIYFFNQALLPGVSGVVLTLCARLHVS
jgi:hypothetical protein